MIKLSVIIISFNTKTLTQRCIDSVLKSLKFLDHLDWEIIVLDNNSTDGSLKMLLNYHKNKVIKLITSNENLGFSKGNNMAVKEARGESLLFLNSDIEVIDHSIAQLYNYFISKFNPYDFVGGKLFEKDGRTSQASCGYYYSIPVILAALFLKGDQFKITRFSPTKTCRVDWVSGACFICKKQSYQHLNGFDENIFMYMEEIDLFFRAKKENMTIGFYPDAKFIHFGSGSSKSRTQPILQVYKGFLYLYKKHHNPLEVMILKFMLKLKAILALSIGTITNNQYLIQTYGKAYKIV